MSTDYLDNILKSAVKQLDEKTFVTVYLPLLFNENPAAFNMLWLNHVAENPHVRVEIVDNNKNVLFSVPPLRTSHSIKTIENLNFVLSNKQAENEVKGAKAAREYETLLPLLIRFEKIIDPEHIEEWKQILIRYNLGDKIAKEVISDVNKIKAVNFKDSDDGW